MHSIVVCKNFFIYKRNILNDKQTVDLGIILIPIQENAFGRIKLLRGKLFWILIFSSNATTSNICSYQKQKLVTKVGWKIYLLSDVLSLPAKEQIYQIAALFKFLSLTFATLKTYLEKYWYYVSANPKTVFVTMGLI